MFGSAAPAPTCFSSATLADAAVAVLQRHRGVSVPALARNTVLRATSVGVVSCGRQLARLRPGAAYSRAAGLSGAPRHDAEFVGRLTVEPEGDFETAGTAATSAERRGDATATVMAIARATDTVSPPYPELIKPLRGGEQAVNHHDPTPTQIAASATLNAGQCPGAATWSRGVDDRRRAQAVGSIADGAADDEAGRQHDQPVGGHPQPDSSAATITAGDREKITPLSAASLLNMPKLPRGSTPARRCESSAVISPIVAGVDRGVSFGMFNNDAALNA